MSEEKKNPPGQPTKYKEEHHCERVRQLGKQGYHVYEIASDFDVHLDTLYEWNKVHPKFSVAFTAARRDAKSYVLSQMRLGPTNPNYNPKATQLLARFLLDKKDLERDEYVNIPGFNDSSDPLMKLRAVMDALGANKITPKEAEICVGVVEKALKMKNNQKEIAELMDVLKAEIDKLQNSNLNQG